MHFNNAKDPEVGPITGWPPHKNVEESKNVITYDINSEKLTEEQKEVPRIWNDLSTNEQEGEQFEYMYRLFFF